MHAGAAFFLMFLICRVITASLILGWMAACVMALPSPKPVSAQADASLCQPTPGHKPLVSSDCPASTCAMAEHGMI